MTNIVQLKIPSRIPNKEARISALLSAFADHRRHGDDVFWLKENAELLNILESSGQEVSDTGLSVHIPFYENVENRLGFFPQYYRFLLSITLDLEALGMPGDKAAQLVDWADAEGLARAELSDLQRFEARRLMARRGRDPLPEDQGLEDRMRAFADRSATFSMPNKKAVYELTHTVFYLSEYGRHDPRLGEGALTSLHFAGLLAFLDQNADMLAEICVALVYAGTTPPLLWTDWLERETALFGVEVSDYVSVADDYHEFLVCNWYQAITGGRLFAKAVEPARMRFDRALPLAAPLREMSECMFEMSDARQGDWTRMRAQVTEALSPEARNVLSMAETSTDLFEDFFHGFARTGLQGLAS